MPTIYKKTNLSKPTRLKRADPYTTTVREYFGAFREEVNGTLFGIEVEVEDSNDRYPSAASMKSHGSLWKAVEDNSLRNTKGEPGGREFISASPISYAQVPLAVEQLSALFKRANMSITPSIRTSVHVHMNVQDMTLEALVRLLLMYYVAEPLLSRYNGAEREHNLFALQATQAPLLVESLMSFLEDRNVDNGLRYSALNYMPLRRGTSKSFGTIEFRAGRGLQESPSELIQWLSIINELRLSIDGIAEPTEVIQQFSSLSPVGFIRQHLPLLYASTRDLFEGPEEMENSLRDALRVVQCLAYDIDWGKYEPEQGSVSKKKKYVSMTTPPTTFNRPLDNIFIDEATFIDPHAPAPVTPTAPAQIHRDAMPFEEGHPYSAYYISAGEDPDEFFRLLSDFLDFPRNVRDRGVLRGNIVVACLRADIADERIENIIKEYWINREGLD